MDVQQILFVAIVIFSVVAFAAEWFPIEVTALLTMGLLLVTNLVSPTEAVRGFSNPAVITIGSLFIITQAFMKSGLTQKLGQLLAFKGKETRGKSLILFFLITGIASAFLNNTAIVALFMPVAFYLAGELRLSPSKVLIPLSYSAIVGGTCTLIGTSTNLLVADLGAERGIHINLFDLAPLGILLLLLTLSYNYLAARRWLPSRIPLDSLTRKFRMTTYLTEVKIPAESPLVGKTCLECELGPKYNITVLEVIRDSQHITSNIRFERIQPGDVLLVQASLEGLSAFKRDYNVLLLSDVKLNDKELNKIDNVLIEALVAPASSLAGRKLREIDFRKRYGAFVLAIRRHRGLIRSKIANVVLKHFDSMLIMGPRPRIEALAADPDFIVLKEVSAQVYRPRMWWVSILVILGMVIGAAFNIIPIMVGAVLGAILIVALNIISPAEAYKSINWTVIFLIAALIPFADAMENVQLPQLLEGMFGAIYNYAGASGLLFFFLAFTMIFTNVLSNNATAILMTPMVIDTAQAFQLSPKPFLLGVMYAASLAFMTPTGYQTNAMVFAPGGYRYSDFLKTGLPLQIAMLVILSLLIPVVWPLGN